MAITASEARKNLFPLIEKVNDDHAPVEILSRKGSAVLMSKGDYDSWVETMYVFSTPANARRLIEAIEQARHGEGQVHDLIEDE